MSLVQLGSHLRIEESLRAQENDKPKGKDVAGSSSVNMVEDRRATKTNERKGKRKVHDNKHDGSNKKSKLTCWKCGKSGHFKRDCRVGKGGNSKNINGASGSGEGLRTIIQTKDDDVAWWIDSGATTHACKDRGWFKVFQPVDDGSVLHMGNESSAPIVGVGSVVLKFTFGKTINLSNVCMFLDFSVGIIHETTAPYTPQQNGVSERKNRVLKEMVNSMLSYSGLSDGFWGEAMLTACYLLNRVPKKGTRAVVRLPEPKKKSLGERVNTVIESRDAIFDET
ncbi:UNVERIFIED_CONTAM: Retrovirus-related Pol polyprotein from transposon TNT 1-94 [Sesamum latifolium]|uniref:Retrovirus-related Pol polyprotein from transposon TNT 1-94 n=1 Tax=Sesamum latifolium TaxID=2727402 RepID=A0AAW2X6Q8_9LAMI